MGVQGLCAVGTFSQSSNKQQRARAMGMCLGIAACILEPTRFASHELRKTLGLEAEKLEPLVAYVEKLYSAAGRNVEPTWSVEPARWSPTALSEPSRSVEPARWSPTDVCEPTRPVDIAWWSPTALREIVRDRARKLSVSFSEPPIPGACHQDSELQLEQAAVTQALVQELQQKGVALQAENLALEAKVASLAKDSSLCEELRAKNAELSEQVALYFFLAAGQGTPGSKAQGCCQGRESALSSKVCAVSGRKCEA